MTKRGLDDVSTLSGGTATATPANNQDQSGTAVSADPAATEKVSNKGEEFDNDVPFTSDEQSASSERSVSSPNTASSVNGANVKKIKVGHENSSSSSVKSRVVHIRNIPPETTVSDLKVLALPFGTVTKHIMVRSKGQAFIEFESSFSAMQMANFWVQTTIGGMPTTLQPTLRGRHVHCQISNHKELKTTFDNNNSHNGNNNNSMVNGLNNNNEQSEFMDSTSGAGAGEHSTGDTSATPSPVIRVVVENQVYAVNLDSLYTIFSRAGKVCKIVTFTKNNTFQVLVQFADVASSIQAKHTLDGQNMFQNANSLRIEYSKLQNLIVKFNNEKSRDYTQNGGAVMSSLNGYAPVSSATSSVNGTDTVSDLNSLLSSSAAHGAAGLPFPPAAGTVANPYGLNGHNVASSFAPRYMGANTIHQALTSAALAGGQLINSNAAMFAAAAAATGVGVTGLAMSPVVLVSGLNTNKITPDALFTLFGVYGDVVRVKILFNKKDTALIQMAEPSQAQLAITYLDRVRLYGSFIRVMSSKHQLVQMPKEGHQDSGLTKDYTNSSLHRFKRPGSKNYNNIYPPSETLHVSNIPSTVSEDDLKRAFLLESGCEVAKFKFFPNDRRMALVEFEEVEDAIRALIQMHNFKVAEHAHLRVSFSKSPV